MANVAANVSTGKPKVAGAIYWAAAGTTLPTSATAALTSFTALGYVSEDGVTNDNSPSSDVIKAWGGDTVINAQTERPDSFNLTLIECLNIDVLKRVYGDANVSESSGAITVMATSDALEAGVWVIDMILKGGKAKRIVIPAGTISSVGTITYKDDEAIGYELTITDTPVYDSTAGKSVYHYEYIA